MTKKKEEKKLISEVNYDSFDNEITTIAKKSRIVRTSINDSLHVDEKTLRQMITV